MLLHHESYHSHYCKSKDHWFFSSNHHSNHHFLRVHHNDVDVEHVHNKSPKIQKQKIPNKKVLMKECSKLYSLHIVIKEH